MNSTQLVDSIKFHGSVPEAQIQFSPDVVLFLATHEMRERLAPFVIGVNQSYFEYPYEIAVTKGKAKYRLPSRASFGAIAGLYLVSDSGMVSQLTPIVRTQVTSINEGPVTSYYYEGNAVVLYPTPNQNYTLIVPINLRPPEITQLSKHGQITDFDPVLRRVTLSSIPSTLPDLTIIDFQKGSSGYETIQIDNRIESTDTVNKILTLRDPLPDWLEAGDYISPAETAPYPGVPLDLHSTLALMGASRCLLNMGQFDQKAAVDKMITDNLKTFGGMMFPRSNAETQKITSQLV